ncbi:uncharacterized protein LOC114959879 isoform X2 [Acropora millepora]|uniref:uncharacterized protein LOC114959879 isoform X2 n=1 Tax=Acropora millepora TaxID=45264 RepID=UPI001CF22329|nr:uncharacterized protein LOC114959879 isoform X2 [Acropora millepora]
MGISFLVCAMLSCCVVHCDFVEGKIYTSSIIIKQKLQDIRATPALLQFDMIVGNIEKAIRNIFKNDSNFGNVKVIQLREQDANNMSTIQRNIIVDMQLSFYNRSRVNGSIENLFSVVQSGALSAIPVQRGSLVIEGLPKVSRQMPVFHNEWPSGNYGLPKPRTGCPDRSWREGFRYHDSENAENTNWKSNKSHLSGNVTLHGIRQEFCIHLKTRNEQIPWPRGKYCIYRKGGTCPFGLHEAFGSSECQQVQNHKVTLEYLQFDDEDQGNTNSHSRLAPFGTAQDPYNTRIYYCYYEPIPLGASFDTVTSSSQDQLSASTQEREENLVPTKATRFSKFVTGGGVGMILMSSAVVVVFAGRFTSKDRTR